MMSANEALVVVRSLETAGIHCGVSGGWGVDALLARETRSHRDIDLAIDADELEDAIQVLAERGYEIAVAQRPVRVELSASGGRQVDLHPVRWDDGGTGHQQGFDGQVFVYPPGSISAQGRIAGQVVRCATPQLQMAFHAGYQPQARDRADVAALVERFGVEPPAGYQS